MSSNTSPKAVDQMAAPGLNRAAFLDRDGVIIRDFGYVSDPRLLEFMPGAADAIRRLNELGYLVIVATNQSGIARGYFTVEDLSTFHRHMLKGLSEAGARIDDIFWCPYHPDGIVPEFARDHDDRKPGSGMLVRAIARHGVDPERSFMIGDKESDVAAARGAGMEGHLYDANEPLDRFVGRIVGFG